MRKLLSVMALFVISLLTVSMVSALDSMDLEVVSVKVNGDEVDWKNDVLTVEEGQTLKVRVGLKALSNNVEDVEVEAKISGYEHGSVVDSIEEVDVTKNTVKYVTLELDLPADMAEKEEQYLLRLRVLDQNTQAFNEVVTLNVESAQNAVRIADVAFSPSLTVKAGRSLLTTVLVENIGEKDEEDVKVTVEVPELNLKASEFIDELEFNNNDDSGADVEEADEMQLNIPADTKAGEYTVKVTVHYDDLTESVSETYTLTVVESEFVKPQQKSGKTVLAAGPEMQTVAAGKTATYAVALTNDGSASKAYTVEVATGDWATASVSEKLVVLEPGQSKVVYVDLTAANDATAGEHLASLTVKSGSNVLETVVLKATVAAEKTASNETSLRNGLEIALVVLVVLLVLLGLVIGFSRLRRDDEGEEKYY